MQISFMFKMNSTEVDQQKAAWFESDLCELCYTAYTIKVLLRQVILLTFSTLKLHIHITLATEFIGIQQGINKLYIFYLVEYYILEKKNIIHVIPMLIKLTSQIKHDCMQ